MRIWKLLFVALIFLAGFVLWQLYVPVCCRSEPTVFEIGVGESFSNVTSMLQEEGLIRNKLIFIAYARLFGLDEKIKAGRFRIEPDFSEAKILTYLVRPDNGEISVTIPEGFSVFDIDKRLVSLGLIRENEFLSWTQMIDLQGGPSKTFLLPEKIKISHMEGILFPDTYFVFSKNFAPTDLGFNMIRNFQKKVTEGFQEDLKKNRRSISEIITMASILEKEVRTKEDYPLVAGILWKRLDHGWPLQADATLLYGKKDRSLSTNDLREDSPYNTYTRRGLPPTPIGNPGLETIRAALRPVESSYWFYLTAPDGKVIYAKTNEEHNENKRKFL